MIVHKRDGVFKHITAKVTTDRQTRGTAALIAFAGLVSVPVFIRMSEVGVASDILNHIRIARLDLAQGRWYSYTLWSPLLAVTSMNGSLISFRAAAVALLVGSVIARALLVRRFLTYPGRERSCRPALIAAGITVATPILAPGHCVVNGWTCSAWTDGSIYLGRFSGAVWHNSTTIVSLPFVLLAAWAGRSLLLTPSVKRAAVASLGMTVSSLFKPNFALAALPVLGVFLVVRLVSGRFTCRIVIAFSMILVVPTVLVVVLQFFLSRSDPNIIQSSFTWDPLALWQHYASSPALALLQSFAFPLISTAVILRRRSGVDLWLWCCWAIALVGVAQVALLGERDRTTGFTTFDGNWLWGAHAATLVLFVACASSLLRSGLVASGPSDGSRDRSPLRGAELMGWCVLALHSLSGALYISRLFLHPNGFLS